MKINNIRMSDLMVRITSYDHFKQFKNEYVNVHVTGRRRNGNRVNAKYKQVCVSVVENPMARTPGIILTRGQADLRGVARFLFDTDFEALNVVVTPHWCG
ncbi:MAG: hypothetical protein JXR12_06490 [Neptunomonas phycophila]|uniref:hypothetical protein n=1 Tax=Neptunomonas phycophila TaxID=1572645 RepID=UPI003B8B49E9